MIKGLRKNGVEVIECHENLWTGIEDRVDAVEKGIFYPKLWKRMFGVYFRLLKKFKKLPDFDVLVVGYPGQFDVFFAKLLTLFKRKPIIWDVFMSIYLVAMERELHKNNSLSVKLLKYIEYIALRIPNKLVIDTKQYANWFNKTYKIPNKKFCLIPTGADDDVFFLEKFVEYKQKDNFTVLYYGTYIPNHGVPYIVEAANLLKENSSIIFQFIGTGPEFDLCQDLIRNYGLENIILYPWMNQEELKRFILDADVVLGAFGKTPQSLMTIQNKIYESMAMGKLIITGESEAVKDVFVNYKELIYCDRDCENDLCNSLLNLYANPDLIKEISQNAHRKFINQFSIKHNGKLFSECISSQLKKG
jgi:glycosyltransferase involved in cell wall biosynthesis